MTDRIAVAAAISPQEQAFVERAMLDLSEALSKAAGRQIRCGCNFATIDEVAGSGDIVVASLLEYAEQIDVPWADAEKCLRSIFARLCDRREPVMICTVFRHVDSGEDPARSEKIRVRIRRLNLLATELSREFGIVVVDLDRSLADVGALRLNTDYRLRGTEAADVGGETLARCLLANALDDYVPFDIQESALGLLPSRRSAYGPGLQVAPRDFIIFGAGRRRQVAAAIPDMVEGNQVGWLVRQVLKRRIGPQEALIRVMRVARHHGVRKTLGKLLSGVSHLRA